MGMDTIIGDSGVRPSGGQRQRLALARALLPAPPILILDEATAMFDPDSELDFLSDCQTAFSNRTALLITHRTASLAIADRVVRLTDGKDPVDAHPMIVELTARPTSTVC